MKPSLSKSTLSYLHALDRQAKEAPGFYLRNPDPLDRLIYEQGVRIQRVYLEPELDLILLLLNSKKVIKRALSDFPRLAQAEPEALAQFETDGIGIHWPELDEDLSLKGFLTYELTHSDLARLP